MSLKNKIKSDIYASNKTMKDLADCMGLSSSALSNRISGAHGLKLGTVKQIIDSMYMLTGVKYSIQDFFEDESND